jgi:hypothetical protein
VSPNLGLMPKKMTRLLQNKQSILDKKVDLKEGIIIIVFWELTIKDMRSSDLLN